MKSYAFKDGSHVLFDEDELVSTHYRKGESGENVVTAQTLYADGENDLDAAASRFSEDHATARAAFFAEQDEASASAIGKAVARLKDQRAKTAEIKAQKKADEEAAAKAALLAQANKAL